MKNNYEIAVFGENIRKLRYRENLSKQKMAKKLGIGVQSLSLIESGILPKRLSVCILYRIYKEFNITPSGIFSPTDE